MLTRLLCSQLRQDNFLVDDAGQCLGAGPWQGVGPPPGRAAGAARGVGGELVLRQLRLGLELHAAVAALVAVPGQDAHAAVHYVHLLMINARTSMLWC